MNDEVTPQVTPADPLVDRAIRLFTYLGRAQGLKAARVHDLETYRRDGAVHWLHDVPAHPAVRSAVPEAGPGDPLLTVERVPRLAPPEPVDDEHRHWIDGALDEPDHEPSLRPSRVIPVKAESEGDQVSRRVEIDELPHVVDAHHAWLDDWRAWAEQHRRDEPVRALYGALFSTYVTFTGHPEELELVVGTGLLTWTPESHPAVRRHLLVGAARIVFDDDSGRLSVLADDTVPGTGVELEMLDPGLIGRPQRVAEIREQARDDTTHPLHREHAGELARRLVHLLSADAGYLDDDVPPAPSTAPVASFAPALVLRRRSQRGLMEIFERIVEQIRSSGRVPDGIRPLIDPDHEPRNSADTANTDGALVRMDDDLFAPLPVNPTQLRVLERVDSTPQTLIQGPPGTGKTHTAAVLISHLLAQGKRVLVTAQTDRALKEVRQKLPEAVRPLAVAVVGSSREDMSDLRVAVERIAGAAADHDADASRAEIARRLQDVDSLRRRRVELHDQLRTAREREVRSNEIDGYKGTLAAIARRREEQRERYEWIEAFGVAGAPAPLSNNEIAELRALLLDEDLQADESDSSMDLPPAAQLLEDERFSELVAAERITTAAAERFRGLQNHPAASAIAALPPSDRDRLHARLREIGTSVHAVVGRREPWVHDAVADTRSGRLSLWTGRLDDITRRTEQARQVVAGLGHDVRVTGPDPAMLVPAARGVAEYLADGARIKLGGNGMPKIGPFASRNLKNATAFFDRVRVDGLAPTTTAQVEAFLRWVDADGQLDALDRAWPGSIVIPEEDTVAERLQWHVTELSLLRQITDLGHALASLSADLTAAGVPIVDWFDLSALDAYSALPGAARADLEAAEAQRPIDEFADRLAASARSGRMAPIVGRMAAAVRSRSEAAFVSARARVIRLHAVRDQVDRRERLRTRLSAEAPGLAAALVAQPADGQWDDWLPLFTESWQWSRAGAWLAARDATDVNAVQDEIGRVETSVRAAAESLAATRAWEHAVAPDRLTRGSRASLEQYAALVRRFGKTGGQYREQRRAEIREAMDRCRPAVPVWIMPIYRIADQLRVEPGMFDVVVVDEASQAGLESTFLQYLAPRIVVIGDDKQVSPSAVGIDQQQLRDLGNQYLYDDPFRATWQDPQRSLFDEAKMRFSGMLTLVEHRRCVPEIIEFSNRVAYEPDGVRLVPVRQYGADRLDPIRTVHVTEGYERGSSSSRTNPPEVEAVVEQIEKCLADPRYDGLSMGVISLLGAGQARAIEKSLLERVPPEEWTARDLRCGDAADFQGSERDVMFLSMVAAPDADRRTTALTAALYVQRYNVAASRAKDQLWLFHSIDPSRLSNPEDMRFQLLDHCYSVQRRLLLDDEGLSTEPVPEDRVVTPFVSTFEQRVCNRIIERGYPVLPHHTALEHEIDLVVVGSGSRLAVECDADTWDGPDAHQRDMSRQRELQRCGWTFFRVSEAEFCLDSDAALDGLWARLSELGIQPRSEEVDEPEPVSDPGPPTEITIIDNADDTPTGPIDLAAVRAGLAASSAIAPEPLADDVAIEPVSSIEPVTPVDETAGENSAIDDLEDQSADEHLDDESTDEPEPAVEIKIEIEPAVEPAVDIDEVPPAAATVHVTSPVRDRSLPTGDPSAAMAPRRVGYPDFGGVVEPALECTKSQLIAGLVDIVAVEGPILGTRLHTVYVRASGQRRTGAQIAKALNVAITAAVRQGRLVQDDPLRESGVKPRTYRLPEQPEVRVRAMGSRTFDQIPPAELAAVLLGVGSEIGWDDPTEVYRELLSRYGIGKLGSHIRQRLDAITARLGER